MAQAPGLCPLAEWRVDDSGRIERPVALELGDLVCSAIERRVLLDGPRMGEWYRYYTLGD